MILSSVPLGDYPGGIVEDAAVVGGVLKNALDFDAENGNIWFKTLLIEDVQKTTGFVGGKGGGIKAVGTGILITFLAAAIPFFLLHTADLKLIR